MRGHLPTASRSMMFTENGTRKGLRPSLAEVFAEYMIFRSIKKLGRGNRSDHSVRLIWVRTRFPNAQPKPHGPRDRPLREMF